MEHKYRYYKYKKIPKHELGNIILPGLQSFMTQIAFNPPTSQKVANQKWQAETNGMHTLKNSVVSAGIGTMTGQLGESFANALGNDTDAGRVMGSLFSTGISSIGNTMAENTIKGTALTQGLGKNAAGSLAGAGAGIAANYLGQGITSALGDSRLARGIGAGVATGLGTVGGTVLGNLASTGSILGKSSALFGSTKNIMEGQKLIKAGAALNPYGLGMSVVGSALGAAMGPSKEYAGKYGGITQTMDTVYDLAQVGVNAIPGAGQIISGAMALNKGLSNIFGSTDGMCVCAGTRVYTASGEIINIEDLVQSQGIIGWNENTHEIRPNTIKGIVEPKQKECLEIELKNGITLRCSIDHPILSNNKPKAETHRINGKRIAYRNWEFRRADELKIGDFVGLANNIDYWGTEEMPNAYLVGMLIGDGTYTYENSCRLCSVDPSTWKYIEENNLGVINNCSGIDPNKYSTEYRTYRIINGMQLMKDLGIAYQSSTDKTFPKNLGKYNKDSICKMIAGLYDTDGSISINEEKGTYKITFYQSNLNLLYDLRDQLHKLGIFSTIYTRKASINKLANGKIINSNQSYRLEITDMYSANNFYKNIPLNIDYKKEHLERIHQMLLSKKPQEHNELSGAKQYKIVSIKPIGIQTVYNLEANEDHTYIANGIITHNTKTDAILGSAFMPAPIKWLNMWGSSTTGTFNNQSWQNSEKTSKFMQDGFGNLQSRFDQARAEAGKTYGTFSQGAKRRAQENIDYANAAWGKVLKMADQNALQNIKSQDMSSINNQRYAQMIQGGSDPRTLIGKQGMKILNNATNHNIGMRLLSGAALIDNKQMILCNVPD